VLPSATIAVSCTAEPHHAAPDHGSPGPNYSPREQQGEPKPSVLPSAAIALPHLTLPSLSLPEQTLPSPTLSTLQREQQETPKCSLLPSATVATLRPAPPSPASPYPAPSTLRREQQGRLTPSLLPSAAITQPCHALPSEPRRALSDRTASRPVKLGLIPKDAQHDQATVSASIRFRLSVTGITSVLNRPCLGLQSPNPTSLPASLAISATSPRFSTSGSY